MPELFVEPVEPVVGTNISNDTDTGKRFIGMCAEVVMTPASSNAIIEERMTHLQPVLECALRTLKAVEETLANGGIKWRAALKNAKRQKELV